MCWVITGRGLLAGCRVALSSRGATLSLRPSGWRPPLWRTSGAPAMLGWRRRWCSRTLPGAASSSAASMRRSPCGGCGRTGCPEHYANSLFFSLLMFERLRKFHPVWIPHPRCRPLTHRRRPPIMHYMAYVHCIYTQEVPAFTEMFCFPCLLCRVS